MLRGRHACSQKESNQVMRVTRAAGCPLFFLVFASNVSPEWFTNILLRLGNPGIHFVRLASPTRRDVAPPARSKQFLPFWA